MGDSGAPASAAAQTRFSADGFWWWDGAQWRPALSDDRSWRWTGHSWEAARTAGTAAAGSAVGIMIAVIAGIVILVAAAAFAIIYYAGPDVSNVFSNLVTGPSSP